MHKKRLDWQNPLLLAQKIAQHYHDNWCFLYSGLHHEIKESKSFIALFEKNIITTDDFLEVQTTINNSNEDFFGYIAYESADNLENLSFSSQEFIKQTPIYLASYHLILEFCHDSQTLTCQYSDDDYLHFIQNLEEATIEDITPTLSNIESNFCDQTYLRTIEDIKNKIANGDFYQTNLTRKFYGHFEETLTNQDNFSLFLQLNKISPANYSSFLKINDNHIISSSPELFLYSKNNNIISRPIKGTSPRNDDPIQDQKNKEYLQNSSKEKSENLMIVDLVRNDLSRICEPATIKVDNLFNITSYKNIHHMSSEISGVIASNFNNIDAIKASFPPGSMTGAPKIKAIETASKIENFKRGIYSGSIGMINRNHLNLSVVIRTLITHNNKFEFQVGGAITYNSDPESELNEIYNKAKGIQKLLKIDFKKHIKK